MNERSHEPVALITGCSSGIGKATALFLAERGWRVYATARRPESLSGIASDRVLPIRLDVTDEQSMSAAVRQALSHSGGIDALINNAGYSECGPLEEATMEEVESQFRVNTYGPLRLAQLVLPAMRARRSGRIVNVSTMGGRVAIPFIGLYNASKFALEAMSDALRMETFPFGIHVSLVEPGGVRTNFYNATEKHALRFAAETRSPYHRFYRPMEHFIEGAMKVASPPETVARTIHRVLTARRPRARYAATPDARVMLAILPRLSDGVRQGLLKRMTGLRTARTG